ncbi:MAG: Hsp70 family protein, partial [Clostridia bacterium]|nr:Hsp70 family protein [Clostridia bacterium]
NTTLGRFQLSGIPPARRGVPQIEVTFDIDANGIVNVSAKDLGTGKEQKITITSSTTLSEEEINQKVKEAELYAEEDKKRQESIEVRNRGESLVYETEKTLEEIGDKADPSLLAKVKSAKEALSEALKGDNTDDIKSKTEALMSEFQQLSQVLYQNAQAAGAGAGAAGFDPTGGQASAGQAAGGAASEGPSRDNVVDADFTVDEDK